MGTFDVVILALNSLLIWGFGVAFFSKNQMSTKIAGLVFGLIAVCNILYVFVK